MTARARKQLLERAFRQRAGMQAQLLTCLCTYPIEEHATESGHELWCPSQSMFLSARVAGKGSIQDGKEG